MIQSQRQKLADEIFEAAMKRNAEKKAAKKATTKKSWFNRIFKK